VEREALTTKVLLYIVTASRPQRFSCPSSSGARAVMPADPGCQDSTTASQSSTNISMPRGAPFTSTSTVGFFSARMRRTSSGCCPGSVIFTRSRPSPVMDWSIPTARMI